MVMKKIIIIDSVKKYHRLRHIYNLFKCEIHSTDRTNGQGNIHTYV